MEEILSPIGMWKDFDATSLPLATTNVKSFLDSGINFSELYFSGTMTVDGKVRIFGMLACPESTKPLPIICYFSRASTGWNYELAKSFCKKGFAFFQVDFCGKTQEKDRYTLYPQSLDYAQIENASKNLYVMSGNPRRNCWNEWTAVGRRAITQALALENIDKDNIFVYGSDLGTDLVFKLAATDNRIKAAAISHSKNWMGHRSQLFLESFSQEDLEKETSAFKAIVSPFAFASHIRIPFLLMCETNEDSGAFDMLCALYNRLQKEGQYLCITPRQNGAVGFLQKDSLEAFFKCAINGQFPQRCEIVQTTEGNDLCLQLSTQEEVKLSEIFYCNNNTEAWSRNFCALKLLEGKAKAKSGSEEDSFIAYGAVKYDNGLYACSRVITKTFKQAGVFGSQKQSRLIYDGTMGKDCFLAYDSGKMFLDKEPLVFEKGAYDLYGVGANVGKLATYKISDAFFSGFEDCSLLVSVYLQEQAEVTFGILSSEDNEQVLYRFKQELMGAPEWQKVTLHAQDFKTKDGIALDGWEHARMIFIECDNKILLNSMLWA